MPADDSTPVDWRGNPLKTTPERDQQLLDATMGGLKEGGVRVEPLPDLGAVLVTIGGGGEEIEVVLAPAAALDLALKLVGAALRLAQGDRP
jgi:hypothetical protein